jgi:hypothetical protein
MKSATFTSLVAGILIGSSVFAYGDAPECGINSIKWIAPDYVKKINLAIFEEGNPKPVKSFSIKAQPSHLYWLTAE